MKKAIFIILTLCASAAIGQPIRVHLMGGFANYSGDIQQKRFTLQQANAVLSAGGTLRITDQLGLRGDYSYARLGADDKKNTKQTLINRNLNFKTVIQELTLLGEYDILNLNEHKLSPYVFAGIGVFHFSPYTFDSSGKKAWLVGLSTEGEGFPEYPDRKVYKKTQLNIPLGGGIKYALSEDLYVAFEIGLRKLFTDYLDDVSTTYVDRDLLLRRRGIQAVSVAFRGDELKGSSRPYPGSGTIRGSSKSKDYYYFGQFRISFRMPWFDNGAGGGYRSSRRGLSCPTKM